MTNGLDLLIVHPGAAHGIYGALGDELTAVEPPLWARLIAGYVRDRGFTVKIIDAEAEQLGPKAIAAKVERWRPRLTCIAVYGHQPSASTQQMTSAGAIALAIRGNLQHFGPIIMVGGHVAALPVRTMEEEAIDFACTGEGPVTIAALLDVLHVRGLTQSVPGLVWWNGGDRYLGGKVAMNAPAPLIEDLRELHGNAWDLLPMAAYRAHNWQCFGDLDRRVPYASIYTSLGCPYRCSFCCINAPFASNRYRMRDPQAVVDEIVMLRETYGITTFKIVDEMFVLNEKHYSAIAAGLIRAQHGRASCGPTDAGGLRSSDSPFNIWAYARVDTVKPEKLDLLRRAGFRWLALGIESGSAHVRDGASKKLKNQDIVGVVRAIQDAGINVIGNYIFGLPDDDMASMQATLDLALEANTEFANFYSAMAYPGSPLYLEALKSKAVLPETWRGFSQHNDDCRPLDTKHVTGAQVLAFRDRAFVRYFSTPAYRAMVANKFGAATVAHLDVMLEYKLPRKLLETTA